MDQITAKDLPGLDCGLCGFRTCREFAEQLPSRPGLRKRCLYLSQDALDPRTGALPRPTCAPGAAQACGACGSSPVLAEQPGDAASPSGGPYRDSLGRDFDFYLEHFPEDPGPREVILPHNPAITRELGVQVGDVLIGRPLGMSCGCPVTHCGITREVDVRTGVIVWCVTGPLQPRQNGYKDLGYYAAEAYEGLITQPRCDIRIGMRYFFQPRMCMLQWRHSGLVNFLNRGRDGLQVRVEGLWIG
ncbi:MAG: Fe-S cluster protein [Elusimicrobia bacterium]|nr:Fe-S cluster protein [Elusimicrobiota bacterium]